MLMMSNVVESGSLVRLRLLFSNGAVCDNGTCVMYSCRLAHLWPIAIRAAIPIPGLADGPKLHGGGTECGILGHM